MNVKEELYKQCKEYVDKRLQTVENTMLSNQKALASETKSSAGDKHETGRAMLQLEMEKAGQQLASIQEMKAVLAKMDISKESNVASLGTLIETNQGGYFLSISAGKIMLKNATYFAISTSSPIGTLLLGKKNGDELVWNGRKIKIHQIS